MRCLKCKPIETTYHEGDLTWDVIVLDRREVWGRTDYLITPKSGTGQRWVSDQKLRI